MAGDLLSLLLLRQSRLGPQRSKGAAGWGAAAGDAVRDEASVDQEEREASAESFDG